MNSHDYIRGVMVFLGVFFSDALAQHFRRGLLNGEREPSYKNNTTIPWLFIHQSREPLRQ
jgi:hypothetical protein